MLTYSSVIDQLTNIMVVDPADPKFQIFLPGAIDYAEGRCYRELDLLATRFTDVGVASSGIRSFTLPTTFGTFQVVERLSVLTGSTSPLSATRNSVQFVSPDFLDLVYPSAGSHYTGLPQFGARVTDAAVQLGPAPDQSYFIEVYGTQRPTALSSVNSSTWLTQNTPELFIASLMVFAAGYMRDFGSQADNPQMAQSWETQYQSLLQSANMEELRKKYQSVAWSNQAPTPAATPPRV